MQSSALTEAIALEDDLQQGILAQPMGGYPVAALNLPEDFVRRIRDRRLIDIYRREFRQIEIPAAATQPASAPASAPAASSQVVIRSAHTELPSVVVDRRAKYVPGRPESRGFRAPILASKLENPRTTLPENLPTEWQAAADIVASRLAPDGLLDTLTQVISHVGATAFLAEGSTGWERLVEIGFPVDLLVHFTIDGKPPKLQLDLIRRIANRLTANASAGRGAAISGIEFRWQRSEGFTAADDCGTHALDYFRMQIPNRALWEPGQRGDAVDIAAQVLDAAPRAELLMLVSQSDASALRTELSAWPAPTTKRLTLIEEALPVSQWAQDNGKPGWLRTTGGELRRASLAPRYASQNEDGSVFLPNDSFMADDWVGAGLAAIQSPLLFQGGNLIVASDRAKSRRVLLIGEAEIYRNVALGLSRAQTIEAFKSELAVDDCVVLPSVSFHIDLDVNVRSLPDGQIVALVNDTHAAAIEIARAGFAALGASGHLNPDDARALSAALAQDDHAKFRALMRAKFRLPLNDAGQFSAGVTAAFAGPTARDAAPDFHTFLAAVDTLLLDAPEFVPPNNPYALAYSRAMQRQREDQRALLDALRPLGWKVIAVPGFSATGDSICFLNGLHDAGHFFVPVYGGFYSALDAAALEKIGRALPGITLVPIRTAAVQRRAGGVRCIVAAYGPPADQAKP